VVRLAYGVDAHSAAEARERIGRQLRGWNKPGAAADMARNHLDSARKRHRTTIVHDITRIVRAYDAAVAAHQALREDSGPDEFKPLTVALVELNKAVYAAYVDQPVESDAWGAGNATFEAYEKASAAH
jgi:hypothetical protein